MKRQPLHPRAERRHLAILDGAKPGEQRECRRDAFAIGRVEPLERGRIATPGEDVEDRFRKIDALNLRLDMGAQAIGSVPEAADTSRAEAAGAPRSLFGGVGGNPLQLQ